jgi:hypothetical protein
MSLKEAIYKGYERIAKKLFHKPLRPKPSEFRKKTFKYKEFTVHLKYLTEELMTLDHGLKGNIYICLVTEHPEKGEMLIQAAFKRNMWFCIRNMVRAMKREIG